MAVGRISGPLLKDNLLRNGVNLAFETSLLYLDVVNSRVGINTTTPTNDLSINGITRTTNLSVGNSATLANITFSGSTISSPASVLSISPNGSNPVVYQGTINVGDLVINGNTISVATADTDISLTANGTGTINLNSDTLVSGNLHATGNITADGNISLGNQTSDTIRFAGEVNSDIIPDTDLAYNLGSPLLKWNNLYSVNANFTNISASTVTTSDFQTVVSGTPALEITGSNITALTPNADINLVTSGTGGISLNNLKFATNTITNTTTNGVTQFNNTSETANFTASIAPGPSVQCSCSILGNVLTVSSQPYWLTGGSLTFNGINSYLELYPGFTINQSAYTVETWFYLTGGTSGVLVGGNTNYAFSITINSLSSANNISVTPNNQTPNNYSVGTISTNAWHHIAVTRNSLGVETVFFNGVRSSTGTTSNNLNYQGLTNYIGQNNNTGYFNGHISNFRIIIGSNSYDPTSATITVPTTNLPQVTNTRLLLNVIQPSSYITDSSSIQTLTSNSVVYSTSSPYNTIAPSITIGWVLSGSGVVDGTYITGNLTGFGSSSNSTWTVSFSQTVNTTTMNCTPIIMTVTGSPSGTIKNNMIINGAGVTPSTNITALASGSGSAGTYYVTPSQTVSSESMTGTISSYVKVSGAYGVVIPAGGIASRPINGFYELGMMRYNTDYNYVEIFNGTVWISVAGSSSGVTQQTANDIALGVVLSLG
jgi:hypothetical protein